MNKCGMNNHSRIKLTSEESHPVTDPLGENIKILQKKNKEKR